MEQKQARAMTAGALVAWASAAFVIWKLVASLSMALVLFGAAILLAMALDGPVRWLERRGLPRGTSVILFALVVVIVAAAALWVLLPPFVDEAGRFGEKAPEYASRLQDRLEGMLAQSPGLRAQIKSADLKTVAAGAGKALLGSLTRYGMSALGAVFAAFFVFVLTLYIVANPRPLIRGFVRSFPPPHRRTALRVLLRCAGQIHAWVRATLWLMLIIGSMSGIGLWALGVPSAFFFAIVAGIGEAVPTIGPVLSAIPPVLAMLADDPVRAGGVVVLFVVIQQLENNLIVPRVMSSALKVHPVSLFFFVVALGALLGPIGLLFATPMCAMAKVVYEEVYRKGVLKA